MTGKFFAAVILSSLLSEQISAQKPELRAKPLSRAEALSRSQAQSNTQTQGKTPDQPKSKTQTETQDNLVVTYLDCGQGDAIVIRTPSGKTYMIDTGPNETVHGGNFDAGADVITPFLKFKKIKTVHGLLISHPHLDHYGGAFSVLDNFNVKELIDSGWPSSSAPYLKILEKVAELGISYRKVKEGDKLDWDANLKIEVFGPREETYADDEEKENPNNRSVVIKLTYKKISFLFSGDAELEAEDHLATMYGRKLRSQILKAPHHASKTSSTDEFLDAVEPETAVISCGRRNRFRHPNPSVLERFKQKGLKVYRTDQDGTIEVTCDGSKYSVKALGVGNTPGVSRTR